MMAPSQISSGPSVGERQRAATARGFFQGFSPAPICPNWGGVGNAVSSTRPTTSPVGSGPTRATPQTPRACRTTRPASGPTRPTTSPVGSGSTRATRQTFRFVARRVRESVRLVRQGSPSGWSDSSDSSDSSTFFELLWSTGAIVHALCQLHTLDMLDDCEAAPFNVSQSLAA